jgi:hypothetical protein
MWEGLKKAKRLKTITSPSARVRHSGKRIASPSARARHSGKIFFLPVLFPSAVKCKFYFPGAAFPRVLHSGKMAFPSAFLPRVSCPFQHSGKPPFPECISSLSATLGEDCLPRVLDFWLLRKQVTLGKFCFSRSVRLPTITTLKPEWKLL